MPSGGACTSTAGWFLNTTRPTFGADGVAEAPHAVTSQIVRATKPAFSPDGRRLAFVQKGTGLESSTWVMNENGSEREPLIADGVSGDPSWGQDSTNSWIQSLDGTKPIKITNDTEAINYPAWSPDGERIVFERASAESSVVGSK